MMGYEQNRTFLKCTFRFDYSDPKANPFDGSDQSKGIPMPPTERPYDENALIPLPNPKDVRLQKRDIFDILDSRETRRKLDAGELTLDEVSFLLWAMQGIRHSQPKKRTVPSAGARNPFDTYFYAMNIKGLTKGVYRYVWSRHAVEHISAGNTQLDEMCARWYGCALAVFFVAAIYRGEWRYGQHAHRLCAFDAGHIEQNGYLAAEALGIGCCAIGGYAQEEVDALLGVDGTEEFTSYIEVFGRY